MDGSSQDLLALAAQVFGAEAQPSGTSHTNGSMANRQQRSLPEVIWKRCGLRATQFDETISYEILSFRSSRNWHVNTWGRKPRRFE